MGIYTIESWRSRVIGNRQIQEQSKPQTVPKEKDKWQFHFEFPSSSKMEHIGI